MTLSDSVVLNFLDMSFLNIQLTGTACWLLVQTKLCADRTTIYQRMKNLPGYSWIVDIFFKCVLVTNYLYTYDTYSCSFTKCGLVNKKLQWVRYL